MQYGCSLSSIHCKQLILIVIPFSDGVPTTFHPCTGILLSLNDPDKQLATKSVPSKKVSGPLVLSIANSTLTRPIDTNKPTATTRIKINDDLIEKIFMEAQEGGTSSLRGDVS